MESREKGISIICCTANVHSFCILLFSETLPCPYCKADDLRGSIFAGQESVSETSMTIRNETSIHVKQEPVDEGMVQNITNMRDAEYLYSRVNRSTLDGDGFIPALERVSSDGVSLSSSIPYPTASTAFSPNRQFYSMQQQSTVSQISKTQTSRATSIVASSHMGAASSVTVPNVPNVSNVSNVPNASNNLRRSSESGMPSKERLSSLWNPNWGKLNPERLFDKVLEGDVSTDCLWVDGLRPSQRRERLLLDRGINELLHRKES